MRLPSRHRTAIVLWLAASALGCVALARAELGRLRDAFDTDARIAHRLLSQRVVQHEAVLATLALLQPAAAPASQPATTARTPEQPGAAHGSNPPAAAHASAQQAAAPAAKLPAVVDAAPEQRLPALYPQILSVRRRDAAASWDDAALAGAEERSRRLRRPVLADQDLAGGRYRVVLAGAPASFAAQFDLRQLVPRSEWPMDPRSSPVAVALEHAGQRHELQAGRAAAGGWTFAFRKQLAAESQPFDLVARREVGWGELPWTAMLAWSLAMAAAVAGLQWLRQQRAERERAEELLRLGQVARLDTLGELAAGLAHELNQPLAAALASTQAARRLLDDEPPGIETARGAMRQAEEQARRAADVLARLRRGLERPAGAAPLQPVVLQDAVRNAFYLLEPEFARRQVTPRLEAATQALAVRAEPVALEQILHNLLTNALQALEQVPARERSLSVRLQAEQGQAALTVDDSGPGLAPDVLPRVFEPFFTTREHGLGLGLSLCESLAAGMGGQLAAQPRSPRGASFTLRLPLAATAS